MLELVRLTVFNAAIVTVWLALLAATDDEPGLPVLAPVQRTTPGTES